MLIWYLFHCCYRRVIAESYELTYGFWRFKVCDFVTLWSGGLYNLKLQMRLKYWPTVCKNRAIISCKKHYMLSNTTFYNIVIIYDWKFSNKILPIIWIKTHKFTFAKPYENVVGRQCCMTFSVILFTDSKIIIKCCVLLWLFVAEYWFCTFVIIKLRKRVKIAVSFFYFKVTLICLIGWKRFSIDFVIATLENYELSILRYLYGF